ncbi:MAG TPA: DNA translocase FtsK 4TM domain-containing protein, partial [Chitinophagaceae bacterium]
MATRLKKKRKNSPEKKPAKSDVKPFRSEKGEKVDLKSLARDERTWKIVGAVFLLIALFLFISFISYLFTWKEDQAVAKLGLPALLDNDKPVANLLGRFGAIVSHFFIFNGFGIASFLICTFFFVVGINLLFRRRVFSIWKNMKYVTVGLLVLSVSLAFIFTKSDFPFGGGVGDMINRKLTGAVGNIGTAAILLLLALGYFIWQFNPAFNFPSKKQEPLSAIDETTDETSILPVTTGKTINDLYNEKSETGSAGNSMKPDGGLVINFPEEKNLHDLKVIEKDETPEEKIQRMEEQQPTPEKEVVSEILHTHDIGQDEHEEEMIPQAKEKPAKRTEENLELEIKATPGEVKKEELPENLPPYEPTLDLRDYKYPTLSLLETHGSEKIIQDANELENNKNQIIATLRNYAIEIQKISATVGPTVTLYEIVPAPGVRISRIKNLEDDIALSLAALGIRIIAPIPGKGTIGIEVPNVRKTLVSMKSLLASEKFQINNFSLPIAIGKKIDNENFIVDLASMPHLLMAGATGQGKSVGVNAILISLLYKKHPS